MNTNQDTTLISLENLEEYHTLSKAETDAYADDLNTTTLETLTTLMENTFDGLDTILADIYDGAIDADSREF